MRRIAPRAEAAPRPTNRAGGHFHGFWVPVRRRAWATAVSFLLGRSRAALGYFVVAGLEGLRLADNLWREG